MKGVPDLETFLTKVYKFTVATDSKAIYVDNNSLTRMGDFHTLLTNLEKITEKLANIFKSKEIKNWDRLKALTSYK